jgi:hypothetical protein
MLSPEDKAAHKAEIARWMTLKFSMQELCGVSAWDVYREELEQAWLRKMEDLLRCADHGQIRYLQGVIDGLRLSAALPTDLIARADKVAKD